MIKKKKFNASSFLKGAKRNLVLEFEKEAKDCKREFMVKDKYNLWK